MGGVDKHVEHIRPLPEDIVGAPAHDDAGTLFRQIHNHPALHHPEEVGGGQAVHMLPGAVARESVGQQALPGGGVLPLVLDELLIEAGFHRHLLHQLLVVIGHVQQLRHAVAHGPAAGTEFPTDSDDLFPHSRDPPFSRSVH